MRIHIIFLLLILSSCRPEPSISDLANPSPAGARFPTLHSDGSRVLMSWLQPVDSLTFSFAYSVYENGAWSDAVIVATSDSFFVNWADVPSVVMSAGEPLAAHWLAKVPGGTYAYHVNMAMRQADGSWMPVGAPHTDGTATEHGFVSLLPMDSESVLAVWLDGRNTAGMSHDDHSGHEGMTDLSTAMTLRSAVIHRDGSRSKEAEIDAAVCDCCNTSMATVPDGALAVYRDRDEHEIRDIAISRYDAASGTWSDPKTLFEDGWEIAGCPVNGPRIASAGDHVVVAWFTGAGGGSTVSAIRSTDGGRTFGERVVLDSGRNSGRVDVVVAEDGDAWISWLGESEGAAALALRRWSANAKPDETRYLPGLDMSRRSGFPRMALINKDLLLAWTDPENGYSVKTMRMKR